MERWNDGHVYMLVCVVNLVNKVFTVPRVCMYVPVHAYFLLHFFRLRFLYSLVFLLSLFYFCPCDVLKKMDIYYSSIPKAGQSSPQITGSRLSSLLQIRGRVNVMV